MKKGTLINIIHMDCPICEQMHDVEERERIAKIVIKDEEITYKERFYYCKNANDDENEFVTGKVLNLNLLNARNEYRIKHHLLTSDEIVKIRENYGLSQVDLARLMGWGEATVSRYESKAIQDEAYDTMLRMIKDNPLEAFRLLNENAEKFTTEKYDDIKSHIICKIESYGKEYLSRQALLGEYVDYEEPSDANGYVRLNIDKIEAIISRIAEMVNNLFKVKLMKMLWYIDALSYKINAHAITGLVYTHSKMGALPIGHNKLINLERVNVHEEESLNYDSIFHFYPVESMDYSIINEDENRIINLVVEKFKNDKTKKLVDYMHNEKAYLETNQDDIIPFSLAKEIRDFNGKSD